MNTKTLKRETIMGVCAISAAILCGAARAEEPVGEQPELEEEESSIVSAEVTFSFDSKYLSYGFVDNNEPIMNLDGSLTFFDWVTFGARGQFDVTRYGREAGYKDRLFKATEFHPYVNIGHAFGPDDIEWLPTTIEFSFGYDYEYHPRVCTGPQWVDGEYCEGSPHGGDWQYWTFDLTLPDLWLEPHFYFEREALADNGTYVSLDIGHTFSLIEDVLEFKPSIAQGFGNARRIKSLIERQHGWEAVADEETGEFLGIEPVMEPYDHDALMDTVLKCEFTWTINEYLSLSAYVAYSDFLFDEGVRDGARNYEATGKWTESWNFFGGFALTASF